MEIAIVGTGKVAERNYIPSLLRHDDVSLTLHSRTRDRASPRSDSLAVAGSLDELVEREPEAVFVLTGEQERLEVTHQLLALRPSACSSKSQAGWLERPGQRDRAGLRDGKAPRRPRQPG